MTAKAIDDKRQFDLQKYLSDQIELLVRDALRVTLKNPKQSLFFTRFAAAVTKATGRRYELERLGEHIPSFLIASITEDCNLKCAGCYAHANQGCTGSQELPAKVWGRIFDEADELGVSAILLAGGEPMLRRDVVEAAAKRKRILFPVFTNGTKLDNDALRLFDSHRNLVSIVSIEGDETMTDARRGEGIYKQTADAMRRLKRRGLVFGASVTVSSGNLDFVTDNAFIDGLERSGCKVILFIEYVPVELRHLALSGEGRAKLTDRVAALRARQKNMVIISFPGDEAVSGGCLAAGRGFIHISASGAAEPCPFSPYSDLNLRDTSLRDALKSQFFTRLRKEGVLMAEHKGGCVLFEQEETVARLAGNNPAVVNSNEDRSG